MADLRVIRFSAENFPNVTKLADGLKEIGARHNASAGQVALAWLLGQEPEQVWLERPRNALSLVSIRVNMMGSMWF